MVARDDAQNVPELELLHAQRVQLASRLKMPWWYAVATAFALALGCAMPIGSHYLVGAGAWCGVLAIIVFYLLQNALARVSGVAIGTRTLQYPSGRVWGIAVIAIILAACASETALLDRKLLAASIGVMALATLAGTGCWLGHLRGIRRDLETGRGRMWRM
jgi:hypothetical protein